jgi:DNA processing protein
LTTALLRRFGTAAAVLQATSAELQEVPHIGPKLANALCQAMRQVDPQAELERMDQASVRLLVHGTADYPPALGGIEDPPHLLYIRGALQPRDANALALVGSPRARLALYGELGYATVLARKLRNALVRHPLATSKRLVRLLLGSSQKSDAA